jgi:hypothetical protein
MLEDKPVLIVQDNIYLALDLCSAVEQLQGRVVGPVSSVADALPKEVDQLVARRDGNGHYARAYQLAPRCSQLDKLAPS